ncbi:MAG TPA: exodeoxyribonuclease V subunit gamma [Polyangia bacterium]|nr:exodeoxyribonuclease V subunit gamma [Polyangia bacterium]
MIHLCYSNRTEELLAALSETLAAARAQPGASLFQPTHLVVPNRNVETYVKLGVARALGIAANIETRLLRGFLAQVVRDSFSDVELCHRPHIQGELLGLLHDDGFLAAPELEPVRAYIGAAGTAPDAVDLRRCQLSAELAALFDDYAFSRPEMLAAWREQRLSEGPDLGTERWQRALWRGIFATGGTLAARAAVDKKQRRTLAELFNGLDPAALRLPPAVHIFGISYVARLYKSMFATLAQSTALYIYTLNPCREFWEDLETGGRRPPAADRRKFPPRRAQEQLLLGEGFGVNAGRGTAADGAGDGADENPLLTMWARPGRDNIKLLNQLSDCDFDGRFVDPLSANDGRDEDDGRPPTVLRQLQHDILDRVPARSGAARLSLADDSVTVMACPDSRRELETIAAEIWSLVRADARQAPLRFSDIAVIIAGSSGGAADAGARLNLASAVFRQASELPHTVVDLPLAAESRIVEALELLLALPLGGLGRQDLLRLAMHPVVARRVPDADPVDWLRLTEELGIVSGADHADNHGTYLDRDLFNWDQGLKRVALGAFLTGRRAGDERAFSLGDHAYLAADLPADAQASAAGFGSLIRSLIADARAARTTRQPLAAWMGFLRGLITRTIVTDGADEAGVLARCLAELAPLEELGPPGLAVGYRVACELVRSAVLGLSGRRGQYLADGVTISSFLPMRAIPFRVIFIAGLAEGEFPATDRKRPLDLRSGTRRQGDVSAREQDQYMFLEALLCARERLYCSYVARDPLTGFTLAPSSTLADLIDTLQHGYLAATPGLAGPAIPTRRPPLRRHEDADVRAVFPAAAREAGAAALGQHLRAATGAAPPALAELRRVLPADVWQGAAAALGWLPPPRLGAASADRAAPVVVSTAQIRRFLECPLQGSAEALLSLRNPDDDAEAAVREDEAFDSPRVRELPLLREVFVAALGAGEAVDDLGLIRAYDRVAALKVLDGTLPVGPFGEVVRERHLTVLSGWRVALQRVSSVSSDAPPRRIWFGHAAEYLQRPEIVPALTLELIVPAGVTPGSEPRLLRVAIHGRSEPLADVAGQRTALLLGLGASGDSQRNERDLLRAFIDHVVLSASGRGAGSSMRAVICRPPDQKRDRPPLEIEFLPLGEADARSYLETVVGEMLAGVHPYLLPLEAVVTARRTPERPIPDIVAMWRDDTWSTIRSDFGPVPEPRSYPAPPDDVARALIERRFGRFFRLRRDDATAQRGDD